MAAGVPDSGTGITRSASTGYSAASCRPTSTRVACTPRPAIVVSGRARYTYSNRQPRGPGCGEPPGPHPVLVDRDQLTGLDLADHRGADDVQRGGLAGHDPAAGQPAEHQRPETLRIPCRVQGPLVHEDQRVRAADQRQRGQRRFLDGGAARAVPAAAAGPRRPRRTARSGCRCRWSRRAPPAPAAGSTSAASSMVLIRLPLCPRARLADGVARNVGWAFSHTEAPVVEYRQCPIARCPRSVFSAASSNTCGTRPMSLYDDDRLAVADRDPGRLLAPVLQRVQAEVGQLGDFLARRPDPEDTAGVPRPDHQVPARRSGGHRAWSPGQSIDRRY